jgi:hypothetical protein
MWIDRKAREWIAAEVSRQLSEISVKPEAILPKTYEPLSEIRRALYHWVYVPFNDARVWLELRCLNAIQIKACGDMSLLEIIAAKKAAEEDELNLLNLQENLARAVMNTPTYEEFEKIVLGRDRVLDERRKKLAEVEELASKDKRLERTYGNEINNLKKFVGYLLPMNTMAFLTRWALGVDVSDIKKLSKDHLLEAAHLAKAGGDNPHDHIAGLLTDRDMEEIDRAAWHLWVKAQTPPPRPAPYKKGK